jgi:predicted ATPase
VAALLGTCPELVIIATSRAPLRIRGEREWAVAPLALPTLGRLPAVADLDGNPAITLFVARARDVQPTFALTRTNAAVVAAICRRVEGLPLALELAAARLRLLSPTDLLARLDRALPLLVNGPRDLPTRQRTMRDTIAWSHDLLGEAEQRLLRDLAPFAGGWDLAAAEAVAGGATGADVLGELATLVEQSLVVAEGTATGESRYRLLEPVREYARERLEASGTAEMIHQRHADHYLALAEEASPALEGPQQADWIARLERDHDNLRAERPADRGAGRPAVAARLGWALHIFWAMRGYHREGRRAMAAALGDALDPPDEARAAAALGLLARMHGDYPEAIARLSQALALFRALDDTTATLMTLSRLGHAVRQAGDYARATRLAEEGLALARRVGDTARIVWMLDVLAQVALAIEDYPRAVAICEEALPLVEQIGDRRYRTGMTERLAQAALAMGRYDTAEQQSRAALVDNHELVLHRAISSALDTLAGVAAARGAFARAARLFGAAEMTREVESLAGWTAGDRALYEQHRDETRARLGQDTFDAERNKGHAMTPSEAVTYALEGSA